MAAQPLLGGAADLRIECLRLDGVRLAVHVPQEATVGDLRSAVAAHQEGLPAGQQKLIFCGQALDDDGALLSSLGITAESVVHLVPAADGRGSSAKGADDGGTIAAEWRVYDDDYYHAVVQSGGGNNGGGRGDGDGGGDDTAAAAAAMATAAAASRIRAEWEPRRSALRPARLEAAAHGLRQLVVPLQPRVFYYDPRDPARLFDGAGAELETELAAREEEAAVERRAGLYGALHGELERALLRLGPKHASLSVEDVRSEMERVELQKTRSQREADRVEQEAAAARREANDLRKEARAAATADDFDGAQATRAEASKCEARAAILEDQARALRSAADVDLEAAEAALQALLEPVRLYEQLQALVRQLHSQRHALIEKEDYSQAKLVAQRASAYDALGARFAALAVVRVHAPSGDPRESTGGDHNGDSVSRDGGGSKAAPPSNQQQQQQLERGRPQPCSFVFSIAAPLVRQEQQQQQRGGLTVSRELPVPVFDDSGGIFNDWVQLLPARVCGRVLSEADPIFCAGAVGLFLRGTTHRSSSTRSSSGGNSAAALGMRAAAATAFPEAPSAAPFEPAPTAITSFQQLRQLPAGTVVQLAPAAPKKNGEKPSLLQSPTGCGTSS